MNTNVRAGDKAIVISSSWPENVGIIVDVLHQAEPYIALDGTRICKLPNGHTQEVLPGHVAWVIESLGRDFVCSSMRCPKVTVRIVACHDAALRPLRDEQGDDEMLGIAGQAPQRGRITEWEGAT